MKLASKLFFSSYHYDNGEMLKWSSSNVLDSTNSFLVNNWLSVYIYKTIYKD
ncbi:hypothetical protein BT96DRAFT_575017 [Gymnopus androsaceus JB14]|uniref:Uncharacterized protein n=1 Tax=Gymnopus androsaceus JB14 TaxID=1447944 RepID=A0A6A4GJN8_9AGAR|nr:hypothetical protein BT96DRAFT_575017 [Gymnopus androsaceus JB14]